MSTNRTYKKLLKLLDFTYLLSIINEKRKGAEVESRATGQ